MDPVTHLLTGACVSRAGLNRKTGLATLTLTLAFEAPDIDSIYYFGGSVTGLQHHRGITHSLIGAPFVAAGVIAIVYGVHRWRSARQKNATGGKSSGALFAQSLFTLSKSRNLSRKSSAFKTFLLKYTCYFRGSPLAGVAEPRYSEPV